MLDSRFTIVLQATLSANHWRYNQGEPASTEFSPLNSEFSGGGSATWPIAGFPEN